MLGWYLENSFIKNIFRMMPIFENKKCRFQPFCLQKLKKERPKTRWQSRNYNNTVSFSFFASLSSFPFFVSFDVGLIFANRTDVDVALSLSSNRCLLLQSTHTNIPSTGPSRHWCLCHVLRPPPMPPRTLPCCCRHLVGGFQSHSIYRRTNMFLFLSLSLFFLLLLFELWRCVSLAVPFVSIFDFSFLVINSNEYW